MDKRIRSTLIVIAVYLAVIGILFLFLPRAAESVFQTALPDAALTMLYGQVMLTLAYLAYRITLNENYAGMYRIFIILFGGHVLVFLYQLIAGVATFAQSGPPLIISFIFAALLFFFGKDQS